MAAAQSGRGGDSARDSGPPSEPANPKGFTNVAVDAALERALRARPASPYVAIDVFVRRPRGPLALNQDPLTRLLDAAAEDSKRGIGLAPYGIRFRRESDDSSATPSAAYAPTTAIADLAGANGPDLIRLRVSTETLASKLYPPESDEAEPQEADAGDTSASGPELVFKLPLPIYPALEYSLPDIYGTAKAVPLRKRKGGKPHIEPYDGAGTIVAVVDFGCDFAHQNFRNENGTTRLLALVDQFAADPTAPSGFAGRVFLRDQINDALLAPDPYAALGYDPHANYMLPGVVENGAHGTHVMDIAAGNGRATGAPGVAPGADLVFIQLAGPAPGSGEPWDFGSAPNEANVIDALLFLYVRNPFDRASVRPDDPDLPTRQKPRPLVVNLSLGHNFGAHDGTTELEEVIDLLLWFNDYLIEHDQEEVPESVGFAAVVAAGNDRSRVRHASGTLIPKRRRKLSWIFDPLVGEPPAVNRMTITLSPRYTEAGVPFPPGYEVACSVKVIPPGDQISIDIPRLPPDIQGAPQKTRIVVNSQEVGYAWWNRNTVTIEVRHRRLAETWVVRMQQDGAYLEIDFHAWIDCPYPDQSRFYDVDADPSTTLSGMATGRRAIVVGAYDALSIGKRAAVFSSAGPSLALDGDGEPVFPSAPQLSAPGVEVWAAKSKGYKRKDTALPWRTAATVAKSGTSMAAPHVAGAVALMLQKNNHATNETIRQTLIDTTQRNPPARQWNADVPPSRDWDPVYGYGRLHIAKAIDALQIPRLPADPAVLAQPADPAQPIQPPAPPQLPNP